MHTLKGIEALLRADTSVPDVKRMGILRFARNGEAEPVQSSNEPRIYSRERAAELLGGRTTRFVDQLSRKGMLKKFVMPGGKRAIGVTGQSLQAFIQGT